MTCKDCIHYEVCSPFTSPNESFPEVNGCKCFKDKSRYIELPQKEEKKAIDKKKYYTPEEVRKMSRAEVKANYTCIIESMKHWD